MSTHRLTVWLAPVFIIVMVGCGRAPSEAPQGDTPAPAPVPEKVEAPSPAPSPPQTSVEAFEADGVLVDAHDFFDVVQEARASHEDQPLVAAGVAGKALVTADGVYAFIETPSNLERLQPFTGENPVHVAGMVHHAGRLLHVDSIKAIADAPEVDLERYRSAAGERVTLGGNNKCQCGIKIAELHTSCQLGHLHHLEADDGRLYHYLQIAQGRDAFQGKNSHFKPLEISGLLLPGRFLLVESAQAR